MQSGKEFLKLAREAIEEHPEAFEAMLEFERTKKLPKPQNKERLNFTLNRNIIKKLRKYAKEQNQKLSNIVEKLIEEKLTDKQ
mgnify:CR=1 FL=1